MCAIFLPLDEVMKQVQQWANDYPGLAMWLVGITFIVAVMLLLPVSPIVMMAGLLFGLLQGFVLIWTVGLISSILAFWAGRTIARPWVQRMLERHTSLATLDQAISRNGLLVAFLTRLSLVIPFGPCNYCLSLTGLKFRDYLLATNIGMIPSYFFPIYLGTTTSDIAAILGGEVRPSRIEWATGSALMLGVFTVIFFIVRSALIKLREEMSGD